MDTSETYIKMCDCPEIRDLIQKIIETDHKRKVETRRRFADTKYSVRIPDIRTPDVSVYDEDGSPMRRIDLLSQDQIQEMVGFADPRIEVNISELLSVLPSCDTWEKFWLAFYMWEKHGKVWNGKKWKKKA